MDETPVLESTPEVDTNLDETSLESTESVETGAETSEDPSETGEQTETEQEQPTKDEPALNGTKLSAAAKQTLDEIRAKNPKLAAELKSALFEREALKAVIPGGVNGVKELNQKLTEFGGFEGIEKLKSDVGYWETIDQKFTNGDPAFIEEISAASPEAFVKIIPSAMTKYQEVSPDGFSKYVAGIFQNDMHQAGIFNALDRLSDFLPADQPRVKELWASISTYLNRIGQLANQQVKPVAAKEAPKQDEFSAERQKFEQERDQFQRTQYMNEANTERVKIFNTSWTKATTGLKLTAEQAASAKELYLSRLTKTLQANPDIQKKAEAYYKAGDKAGYVKYMASIYNTSIPKAIESALTPFNAHRKPGPRPGQQPTAAPTSANIAAGSQNNGFLFVSNRPKATEIDWTQTSRALYTKGMAVLVGGKKVQFKR